ncbi:hypothetical protein [Xanthomonas graminis]|uniref:Uncharacterized protein n=2 Tax=Xanthomonas translucens group TaxID=3390202 RepID=A0A1M4IER7_9XANT|nr:hypothetical protein [Xanthomonas translucens]EKU26017.1 hypothetical protein XTG29_00874 [Xanthomonas translucens pv. graminis ART-Xtg29]UKE53512.1 hypothetical protein KFS84_14470 [Xanthomonas translucens pv. graminis]WIH13412.1 hypothetical protein KM563_06975 [Xanthomonas translucens pv. graminis]WIH17023.1 hypothetical protein KM433_06680 [Xanthomonas translucens pv. graminis]SBV40490.1 hypothetical protein XTGART2_1097 [Xanthomonas translucens pv. graminis]
MPHAFRAPTLPATACLPARAATPMQKPAGVSLQAAERRRHRIARPSIDPASAAVTATTTSTDTTDPHTIRRALAAESAPFGKAKPQSEADRKLKQSMS